MKLVEEARQFWRWWSVRLAAVAGMAAGYFTAYPDQIRALLAYVPEQWRPVASIAVGMVVFALPTLVRVMKQGDGNA